MFCVLQGRLVVLHHIIYTYYVFYVKTNCRYQRNVVYWRKTVIKTFIKLVFSQSHREAENFTHFRRH